MVTKPQVKIKSYTVVPSLGGFAEEMGGRVICLGGTTCIVNMSDIYCLFVYFSCHVVELLSYLTSKIFLCLYETSYVLKRDCQ